MTSLGNKFRYNTLIRWFDELELFTKVTVFSASGINNGAEFSDCTNLEKIKLPPYLTTLGNGYSYGRGCFRNTKIEEIYIPDTVTKMTDGAFISCSKLKKVRWSANLNIGYRNGISAAGTFQNCSALEELTNIGATTSLAGREFKSCNNYDFAEMPWENITFIGEQALAYCSKLPTSIVFKKLTRIDNYFARDSSIRNGYFPAFSNLGTSAYAWRYCPLTLVDFSKSLTGVYSKDSAHTLVLHGDDYSSLTISYPQNVTRVYVHAAILEDFKTRFTSLASKTFAIGGEEWTAAFGSSDEWADYTYHGVEHE